MKVVKEEIPSSQQKLLPEVQKKTTDPQPSPPTAETLSEAHKESPNITADKREKYITTGLVIAGLVAGYFILTRLTASLGFPGTGMVAFLLLGLSGGIYLYNLYVLEMSAVFSDSTRTRSG